MSKRDYIDAEDFYDIACQWMNEREYLKAIETLRQVISLNAKFMYAYIDLAHCYAKLSRYHDAVQVLKRGSRIDPGFHRLFYLMAKYSYKNGEFQNALKNIELAMQGDDDRLYERVYRVILKKFRNCED